MRWLVDDLASADEEHDIVGIGGTVTADSLASGYRLGVFPMDVPVEGDGIDDGTEVLAWFCPAPRGVLPLDGLRVPRSLAKSCRRFTVTVNSTFDEVLDACADPEREGTWLTPDFIAAYRELHRRGFAHSFESRNCAGDLVGGLIAVEIGGLLCGDTMFHRERDASKVALVALVDVLRSAPGDPRLPGGRLLDVQWATDHLRSLGAVEVSRPDYLRMLDHALALPGAITGR